jgi:hypothetical protein
MNAFAVSGWWISTGINAGSSAAMRRVCRGCQWLCWELRDYNSQVGVEASGGREAVVVSKAIVVILSRGFFVPIPHDSVEVSVFIIHSLRRSQVARPGSLEGRLDQITVASNLWWWVVWWVPEGECQQILTVATRVVSASVRQRGSLMMMGVYSGHSDFKWGLQYYTLPFLPSVHPLFRLSNFQKQIIERV